MAAIPPGWNASGKQITDPVAFVESILVPIIERSEKEDELTPTYETIDTASYIDGLVIEFPESFYQYQSIPSLGLTRIAANGDGNCWFDSFLTCMSPSYRSLSARNRIPVTNAFRKWCADHISQIIKSIPQTIRDSGEYSDFFRDSVFKQDISNVNKEIDTLEGLFIAWFFGVNCIVFATPGKHPDLANSVKYEPICETMIQSPNCKVICMIFSGNHFEPLIHAKFDTSMQLNETTSQTIFSWTDAILCTCIQTVLRSDCSTAGFGMMTTQPWKITCAAAGGRRRRVRSAHRKGSRSAHHRQSKPRRTKRRSTHRRRAY